ncbi:TMEM175 family protein [Polyangium sp. y55x31]|uniref:TMEM175 family protein n=1 Tax=Polyangium sp. y55x31 TaxID=3042688 RepID=UPI0024824E9E|nr:TMEM175 family protein [Polyangium sp. y55x31]MDI1480677.1 TMEM175 family protein [Polyangium sp. y55x31]
MALPPVPHEFASSLRTSRIEALSDAAFGIVMTILVLEIPVPEIDQPTALDVPRALLRLWPNFLGYFVSFVMLGMSWVAQHEQFHFIKRADQALLWMTMLFLMLIATVPFTTTLIGRYLEQQSVVVLYGAHLLAISLVHHATWRYAAMNRRLVDPHIDVEDVEMHLRRSLTTPVIYLVAIGLSFMNTVLSVVVYALVPLVYGMLPSIYAKRKRSRPRER